MKKNKAQPLPKSRIEITLKPIRLAEPADLEWLYQFIRRHHGAPQSVLPTRSELKNPSFRYFRAFHGTEVVGTSCYEIRTSHLVETHKTIVRPELRGKGYGKAISEAIELEAFRKGFRKIRTTIYSYNLKIIQIKLGQGYRIEGFHPDHEAPGLHEYSLGKLLPDARKKRS